MKRHDRPLVLLGAVGAPQYDPIRQREFLRDLGVLALAKLAARLDTLTDDAGDPIPWCFTRSYCAPELGYCIWVGHTPFFRPSLTQAIRAANQHVLRSLEENSNG